ncbi:MAG: transglutaminase family protein [Candidatus Methanosuratus sp.]|nr:transglutaminase family protein [Candidatus Methanosuratincola sp.]
MGPIPILIALLLAQGTGSVYSYNLSITLVNGASALDCADQYSPCYALLNQNVFKDCPGQTAIIESVIFNGTSAHWETYYDLDGNPLIRITGEGAIEPYQNATVTINFRITIDRSTPEIDPERAGEIFDIPRELRDEYPLAGIWDLSSLEDPDELFEVAESIRAGEENVLLILQRLIVWFEENMVYSYNNTTPQTVWETYSRLSGDCDDQANLFVMFCRIYGIPAYTAIGPIYIPGQVQSSSDQNLQFHTANTGWHGWAMVYVPSLGGGGAWLPVDLTYFGGDYLSNGHIMSESWERHITGAAFYRNDAAVLIEYINHDHISEYSQMRDAIIGSDCLWVECHAMSPVAGPIGAPDAYAMLVIMLTIAAAVALSIWAVQRRRKKHPSL